MSARKTKKETFSYFAPDAKEVKVAGEFTGWEQSAIALKKAKGGIWKASVSLSPGEHQYRFLVDGQWRNDPDCVQRVPNDFGSENCIRSVE